MRRVRTRTLVTVAVAAATGLAVLTAASGGRDADAPPAAAAGKSVAAKPSPVSAPAPSAGRPAAFAAAGLVPPSEPMPDEYQVLLGRNRFLAGTASAERRPKGEVKVSAKDERAADAESKLVLRGVMVQEGRVVALVEDLGSQRVTGLRAGDAVARGKVEHVGFDGMEYVAGGRATRVSIGTTLGGHAAPVIARPAPAAHKSPEQKEPKRKKDKDADGLF